MTHMCVTCLMTHICDMQFVMNGLASATLNGAPVAVPVCVAVCVLQRAVLNLRVEDAQSS